MIDDMIYRNNGRFSFLGLQNHCGWCSSHEIRRHLLLGRKFTTNLNRVSKSRDITLATMVCIVKAIVFPVVVYMCESWTKRRLNVKELGFWKLWCWRRLLRVPWTARKSNHSILKEINPENSWKGWCWNWISNTLTSIWSSNTWAT